MQRLMENMPPGEMFVFHVSHNQRYKNLDFTLFPFKTPVFFLFLCQKSSNWPYPFSSRSIDKIRNLQLVERKRVAPIFVFHHHQFFCLHCVIVSRWRFFLPRKRYHHEGYIARAITKESASWSSLRILVHGFQQETDGAEAVVAGDHRRLRVLHPTVVEVFAAVRERQNER